MIWQSLYYFRMCAWGMFDPDRPPKQERKVRQRQIRQVIEDLSFTLHISGSAQKTKYTLLKGEYAVLWWDAPRLWLNTLPNICQALLPAVDAKFPPTDANPTR